MPGLPSWSSRLFHRGLFFQVLEACVGSKHHEATGGRSLSFLLFSSLPPEPQSGASRWFPRFICSFVNIFLSPVFIYSVSHLRTIYLYNVSVMEAICLKSTKHFEIICQLREISNTHYLDCAKLNLCNH